MTYATARVTCRFGAPSMPGPAPERPAPSHGMTWAEMAAAEGHVGRAPRSPGPTPLSSGLCAARKTRTPRRDPRAELLRLLAERGQITRSAICTATGLDRGYLCRLVSEAIRAGLLVEGEPAPGPRQGRPLALTPAGRAKAEAAR